jgi:N-dimethylarginine dimethylaminohydrolase
VKPSLSQIPTRPEPNAVLMCEPTFFEVKDTKNPFMAANVGATVQSLAAEQWEQLKRTFENLGHPVKVIQAAPEVEDMVFAANQVLPGIDDEGKPLVVLSEMLHESRRREVPFYSQWFEEQGYRVVRLCGDQDPPRFEGQGDAIWHPGRRLLWIGYGFRTQKEAHEHIAKHLRAAHVSLQLVDPQFYHLDTAFCPLDENTVMYYPPAFTDEGVEQINTYFENTIAVGEQDAHNFACNAVALGKNVILQQGSTEVCEKLRAAGFIPVEVDTSEFMKSGGSVFCLKMMIYA